MTQPPVRFFVEDDFARINLAAASCGTPMSADVLVALCQAVEGAREHGVSVLLLDMGLTSEPAADHELPAPALGLEQSLHGVVAALITMPAIVVTVVRGTAAGAELSVAAAGDIVLASTSARFVLGCTQRGLTPGWPTALLPASLGLHRSLHLALLNQELSAAEAHAAGLVAEVHEREELAEAVDRVVTTLLRGSRASQVALKRHLRSHVRSGMGPVSAETAAEAQAPGSPPELSDFSSFVDKRFRWFPSSS